ncbi:MAG: site-2 protease family protein, partial [archaeon]|nr:site-2 protease family protein [archaeon]
MDTTVMILLVLLVIYIPLYMAVRTSSKLQAKGLECYGPCIKINTRLGLRFMEVFGKYHRFWRFFGVLSQVISFGLMLMMVYIVIVAVLRLPETLSSGGMGIQYALAIPGLNPIMPIWYGILALIVALVCHEMAHGLQTVSNGMRVKHTGLLYGVVPLGAFVEPEQEDVDKAARRPRLDLYSAGISTNFIIAVVTFLLFSTVMLGGIHAEYANNAAVYQVASDSPALEAGIPAGSLIMSVDGEPFEYTTDYYTESVYGWTPGDLVKVEYRTSEGVFTTEMRWGIYVSDTDPNGPAHGKLDKCTISYFVYNGQDIYFYTAPGFSSFMETTHGGDVLKVVYRDSEGVERTDDITLGSKGSIGFLGVFASLSGMNLITPDIMLNTARDPFYTSTSVLDYATDFLKYISHPFSGMDPVPDSVTWWYGDQPFGFWESAKALFWIFWLNLLLGITNAIPARPFDGGFIFGGWVDKALEMMGR